MYKTIASAFCLALITATPAYAQSAFVMVIGDAPTAGDQRAERTVTRAEMIERAVEEACVRPDSRDLKMQRLYRECVAELRAELAETQPAPRQLAAR